MLFRNRTSTCQQFGDCLRTSCRLALNEFFQLRANRSDNLLDICWRTGERGQTIAVHEQ